MLVPTFACSCCFCFFFFFKQKTAYEMQRGLVGSEMCIRDRKNFLLYYQIKQLYLLYLQNFFFLQKSYLNEHKESYNHLNDQLQLLFLKTGLHKLNLLHQKRKQQFLFLVLMKNLQLRVLPMYSALIPVSYTHLTLPTILLVQISVVAVSLKKKTKINQKKANE
eukprot:TRINITY_DN26324_c0_g1_i1.p2 TRINITY_DN26324_c0_g1~~TRINITY_DN26324_c0_g1_i1.p2  ORF type:complete len:164 (+),score=38.48 TRINITY_DN26324_c0_g1_i1:24-515(+)